MRTPYSMVLFLAASACVQVGEQSESYYPEDGDAPVISGLDVIGESGNLGGQTVMISGENFGSDPFGVTVVFGSQNAEIKSASASAIIVQAPQGPIEGGAVDVVVGTTEGRSVFEDGYTYDVGDLYQNEVAYVVVNNNWKSCYGGIGSDLGGCETFAYNGLTGIDGRSEILEFVYPRFHSPHVSYWGGTDESDSWQVQVPAQVGYTASIDDLRVGVDAFTLVNPNLSGRFCPDLRGQAVYTYGGSEGYAPMSFQLGALEEEGSCSDEYNREYKLGELQFCEVPEYQENHSLEYATDWPVAENFFIGVDEDDDLDELAPVEVSLNIKKAGIDKVDLVLPEYPTFYAVSGIQDPYGDGEYWGVGAIGECFDGNEDHATTLDDDAILFQWEPSTVTLDDQGEGVTGMQTRVRLALTTLTLGWMGGESYPARASITVDEANVCDYDENICELEVPVWVIYQIPGVNADYGEQYDFLGDVTGIEWGDPSDGGYGYLIITLDRVAEYQIPAAELGGDLVFSYVAGDFGFFEWDHPLDSDDPCGDCLDNDGDGWSDGDDPDCIEGLEEDDASFGLSTCNDGLDNDDDGLVDAADSDCEDGTDGETNCSDDEDNDGDGLIDDEDGECGALGSGVEVGEDDPTWQCVDGEDNDGDGWIDFDDPACESGSDLENDGWAGADHGIECNDGLDNDGHGDIDAADPLCFIKGADWTIEQPDFKLDCEDGDDNDGDGFVDAFDPGCEYPGYSSEGEVYDDPEVREATNECYDGVDNDEDGLIDASDPACWNDGEPDGFLDDEGADPPCIDGEDNDGDGWIDDEDPDCIVDDAELGFGDTECNDGINNDGDRLGPDASDPGCEDAFDEDESE